MNRKNLLSLLVLDLLVMVLAAGLIVYRYHSLARLSSLEASASRNIAAPAVPVVPETVKAPEPAQAQQPTADIAGTETSAEDAAPQIEPPGTPAEPAAEAKPAKGKSRNIGFVYRNSKARKVHLIGDFNDWIPQPLTRDKDHKWSIAIAVAPGDYAYNFVVDGKPLRDPNNPKTCDAGRGFTNSYLKVKPLSEDKKTVR